MICPPWPSPLPRRSALSSTHRVDSGVASVRHTQSSSLAANQNSQSAELLRAYRTYHHGTAPINRPRTAPLVLFGLGVSGAWIANLTRLAPYQPYFLAATAVCLGYGYWLVYRSGQRACVDSEVCARPLPNQIVKIGLVLATILVLGALAFDFLAPLILQP